MSSFRIRALAFSLGTLAFALGTLVFALSALPLSFGSLPFLLDALLHVVELSREFGNASPCSVGAATLDVSSLRSSIGSFAFGIRALALVIGVLPRLKRTLTLGFGNPMLLFRTRVFQLSTTPFGFRAQYLGFRLLSRFLGAQSLLLGAQSLLLGCCPLFIGVRPLLFDALLKTLDFARKCHARALPFQCLAMLDFGTLVFAGRSQRLPIGTLTFVLYALPRFSDPRGLLLAARKLMLRILEFTFGPIVIGVGRGADLFGALPFLIGALTFGIGPLLLRFHSDMELLCAIAFVSKLLLQCCQSLCAEQ